LEVKPSAATRKGKWYDIDSQRQFFDEAAKALKIQNKEDWYGASSARIGELGGTTLLASVLSIEKTVLIYCVTMKAGVYFALIMTTRWSPLCAACTQSMTGLSGSLNKCDMAFGMTSTIRKSTLIGLVINLASPAEATGSTFDHTSCHTTMPLRGCRVINIVRYGVSKKIFYENGGSGLLSKKYNDSVHQALKAVYYQHEWLPWRFKQVSKGYWNSRDTQKLFFDWLGTNLGISKYEDWYRVPLKRVMLYAGTLKTPLMLLVHCHGVNLTTWHVKEER
jgi:hypothetical protein